MSRRIRLSRLACTLLAAGQLVAVSPAGAEVINLICSGTDYRGVAFTNYKWIDTDAKTMVEEIPQTNGNPTFNQYPVTITSFAYTWTFNIFTVTLDRNTGEISTIDKFGNRSIPQYDPICAKGSMPLPAPKL